MNALSLAEIQVLISAAEGDTMRDSAQRLGRDTETVRTQRATILRKLGAKNMTNAVWIWSRNGQ